MKKVYIIGGSDIKLRFEFCERLSETHEIHVFGTQKIENLNVNFSYYYYKTFFKLFSKLNNQISTDTNIYLVNSFDFIPNILISILSLFYKNKIKFIRTFTGLGRLYSKNYRYKFLRPFFLRFVSLTSGFSHSVLQNTTDYDLFKNFKIKNIHLIKSSGINFNFKYKSKLFPKVKNTLQIVFASRLIPEKGILDYIKISNELSKYNNLKFYLIGRANNLKLNHAIKSCKSSNFKHLDHIDQLSTHLNNFDLMIFLSSYGEGVPRILIEGMRSKLPLIAYANRGTNECIDEGYNGFLFKNNYKLVIDKIKEISNNPKLLKQLGSNSFNLGFEKFDLKKVVHQYSNLYD